MNANGQSSASVAPTEREKTFYRYLEFPSLVKGGQIQAHWMADGSSFWYVDGTPDHTVIYKVDPRTNTKTSLFDTARLRQALADLLGHEPPYQGLPFEDFEFLDNESVIKFTMENKEFTCQLDNYTITAVPPLTEDERNRMIPQLVSKSLMTGIPEVMEVMSPDRRWFAGVKDHNIWLRSTYDGRYEPLTSDGIEDYAWDVEGAQWSPDSLSLAVKKVDYRQVLHLPIVHWLKPTEEVEWIHYTKTGGPNPQIELYVIDILSKRQVRVDLGHEPDQRIYPIGWRPDGSEYLFFRMDRQRKKLDFMAADPTTGNSRVVVTEARDTFLFGITHSPDKLLKLFEDGKWFIWRSERDDWAHLYLYDMDGNLISRLTEGAFPVDRIIAVDEKAGWVYFTTQAEEQPYDIHLYRVSLEGKGFERLTEGLGQHDIQFAPSKEYFLDTHSSTNRPPATELRTVDGKLVDTLAAANIDALEELQWGPPEEFVVKAADGVTDLYGVLYKPYDFDPNKKYPVIDHIYGGPQISIVPHRFIGIERSIQSQALAQLGFVVLMVDARGTPERGRAFNDVVYRNFGRHEIPDHVAVLQQLAQERPYMDTERVGIFGLSWGGYMTVRALLTAPDVYHVGIASNPVYDLYDHMSAAIEPYMGLPQGNREGYEYASSLKLAGNLKGKLLLIHSTCDVNATFSATMKMVEAFIRAGKSYDLIVLPEQNHHPAGTSRRYWLDAIRRYFQEHLGP